MIKICFTGPTDKYNRGTEALIVSRVKLLDFLLKSPLFFVPYNLPKYIPNINSRMKPFKRIGFITPSFLSLKTLFIIISVLIWRIVSKFRRVDSLLSWSEGLKAFYDSDIVITTGGDVLSEDYGIFNFLTEFCGLSIAILLKKPVFVYAESIGPFKNNITRFIARTVLNKTHVITTRDEISFNYLKKIGVEKPSIYFTADSAFLLDKKEVNNPLLNNFLSRGKIIGFSLSNAISEWADGNYNEYVNVIAKIIDIIIESYDVNVLLIAHVTGSGLNDDRIINKNVLKKVKNKKRIFNLKGDYNSEELKYIISHCELFIGARMHANIAALSNCIPTVAISYSIKTPGLMKLCGLEDYYIEFTDLNEHTLLSKISDAWENREKIKAHLKNVIPKVKKKALKNGELVKELCESLRIS
ncbi:MAG TPA: hypothetical protein HA298_00640 [Methanobacteriales archaeon]|nr:MAG: hypothetical protein XD44_0228 [Methanobacteriaceae archaeon 41_258]HIH61187.1 hypothetical protein [Methanobacteriales archaeon]